MVTRVGILGSTGRLGSTALTAIESTDDLEAVAIDPRGDLAGLDGVDVVFEATIHDASESLVRQVAELGIPIVVGTSGWSAHRVAALESDGASRVRIVPNFSLGSVLGTHLATLVAHHMGSVEIVETHHDGKVDAPSGTAVRTAEAIAAARDFAAPTPDQPGRGAIVDGIAVHALRLQGVSARQEVIFGGTGETLTIRHDTLDGSAYAAGILLALRATPIEGVTVGIDDLLGL